MPRTIYHKNNDFSGDNIVKANQEPKNNVNGQHLLMTAFNLTQIDNY